MCDYVSHYNILAHIHGTRPISKDTIDHLIEKADRKTMNIVGRTNKTLAQAPTERESAYNRNKYFSSNNGYLNKKNHRVKRFETKKSHSQHQREERYQRDKDE